MFVDRQKIEQSYKQVYRERDIKRTRKRDICERKCNGDKSESKERKDKRRKSDC